MARPRIILHEKLAIALGNRDEVHFQPPEDAKMGDPCIVYERDDASIDYADNLPYRDALRYQVTLMTKNPDSDVYKELQKLPYCRFQRHFATSGLNHDVFVIYH